MALQLGLLHEALKEAGVSDELARRASEEVASYENQVVGLRGEIAALGAYVDLQFERLEGRMNLLTGMVGTLLALAITILVKLFVHG